MGQPNEWCRHCALGSKSFRSESRFTQSHSPRNLGDGLCPALQDQEAAGSNPNSDTLTHFLSFALPQGDGLSVQPFKIKRPQVQIQTVTFSPLALQWTKHPALKDQEAAGSNLIHTAMFSPLSWPRWWTKCP